MSAIDEQELTLDFVLATDTMQIGEVMQHAAGRAAVFVVLALPSGRWAALPWSRVFAALRDLPGLYCKEDILRLEVGQLWALFAAFAADPLPQAGMTTRQAQTKLYAAGHALVVVRADGTVAGVLTEIKRSGDQAEGSWFDRLPSRNHESLGLPDDEGIGKGVPGTLPAEDLPPTGDVVVPPETRVVNVELQGHDPATPLETGNEYFLAFAVLLEKSANALVAPVFRGTFKPDEQEIKITVHLASEDFEVPADPQTLKVPRTGKSKNTLLFGITPKHDGAGTINAVLLQNGNFVQMITIKLQVGAGAVGAQASVLSTETQGRDLAAAQELAPRDLNLMIINVGDGFQFVLTGAVAGTAKSPITLPELEQIIGQVRKELQDIVYMVGGPNNQRVYQTQLSIPPEVNAVALGRLAKAGFRLFQRIFTESPSLEMQELGRCLRELATGQKLKFQVVSQHFMLPWGILYLAEEFDPATINPDLFLGLSHIIEHIPFQPRMQVMNSQIDAKAGLSVSLNVNEGIDAQMGRPFIANQLQYWERVKGGGIANVVVRRTEDEVTMALSKNTTTDQIMYFNCHAISKQLNEGPDSSRLVLTHGGGLTLGDLRIFASTSKSLPGQPLVFINACESAELSPMFYDGFVPYFMAKGARGVIGTECETPALFAAHWADRFWDEFLTGKPVGQVFLDLRQEFYVKYNNIMGLLYALYCDADTRVHPALHWAAL